MHTGSELSLKSKQTISKTHNMIQYVYWSRTMRKITRKLYALLLSLMTAFCLFAPVQAEEETDFDAFLTSEWIQMIEKDYTTMHFAVKDYRSMGITKPEVNLGKTGYDYYANEVASAQASLEKLHSFDYESLTDTQKHDYLVYERDREDEIARYSYPDFKEFFSPNTGDFDSIITTMTEFVFYEKEDITDYLTLVHDFTRIIDDALEFTRQQADKGFFMLDSVLDLEIEQLDTFATRTDDNPLIVIFEKNVDAFEGLTDEERAGYKQENRDAVFNEILPEYEKIKTELEKLRGKRSSQTSLYNYPNGKEYFNALARYKTSTRLTNEEMMDYLTLTTEQTMAKLTEIVQADPSLLFSSEITGLDTPEAILSHLKQNLDNYPEGPEVKYTPSYLDPCVENPNVLAYYMVCPVDDIVDNVIRINGSLTSESMTRMYTTLIHEGFPGHLYQFTYYLNTHPNALRHDLLMMGYQEGWAQYVIMDLLKKSGLDNGAALMNAVNTYSSYVIQAAFDVAVNGLGYDVAKLQEWCDTVGLSLKEEDIKDLYNAAIEAPGEILPYGFGQMKFLEYRERVMNSLGDAYDEVDFHRQLLENGPRPFEVIEDDLARYCESKGATLTKEFTLFSTEKAEINENSTFYKVMKYLPFILIAVAIIVILILFFLIRGIIRLFRKKK